MNLKLFRGGKGTLLGCCRQIFVSTILVFLAGLVGSVAVAQSPSHNSSTFQTFYPRILEEDLIEEPYLEEPVFAEPNFEETFIEFVEEVEEEEPFFEEQVIEEPTVEEPVIEEPIVETDSVPGFSVERFADANVGRSRIDSLSSLAEQTEWPGYEPDNAATWDECFDCQWTHQFLPEGLLYKSYLAGEKEPRFGAVWLNQSGSGLVWETALGGRVGLFRHGTRGAVDPRGWQVDFEGAALTRLDWQSDLDVEAVDYRAGVPISYRTGPTAVKFGYYHLSSHVGDEFLLKNPGFQRRNYVRDSFLIGVSHDLDDDWRMYGEVAVAWNTDGGAEPLELQFGAEYSPTPCHITPFAAINVHFRQEFGTQASFNILAGWQIRGESSNRLLRVGVQHYNGKALQYSFFDQNEQLTGGGLWFDF